MERLYDGKTKTVYALSEDRVWVVFKDDVTGREGEIDPGGNEVVGQVEGKGFAALRLSAYFFQLLEEHGIPTHFEGVDLEKRAMIAKKAERFGLEFIVRFRAHGSFVRRYGKFVKEGQPLHALVEITLKDDQRGDPLILDESLDALGILPLDQVREAKTLVRNAAGVIRADLAKKGLELLDIKFECGLVDGRMVIIDDISTDNMRVVLDGRPVSAEELLEITVGEG